MESGFFLLCDIASKCLFRTMSKETNYLCHFLLSVLSMSSLILILHLTLQHSLCFSSHCVPDTALISPQGYLAFLLLIQFIVWCICKRLGIGDRILDTSSLRNVHVLTSCFWGQLYQTTNVLTRTALLHVSIFYLLRV